MIAARRQVAAQELRTAVRRGLERPGCRFGHMTALLLDHDPALEVLLLDIASGGVEILRASLPDGARSYPSITPQVPAAHWAERALGDFFGLEAEGHPRWKSLILHEAWPAELHPLGGSHPGPSPPRSYSFLEVRGEGVHEIPVGPIHAGIIEPGHFRFSCLGEVITNLEIRLGYQHRGLERRLQELPWERARFAAEAASSDTAAGNALAHAEAVEQILEVEVPPRARTLRTLALEVERVASHLGDLGGLSADIGYSAGAAIFARLRGGALGLGEHLAGSRFQRAFILPGGVARDLDHPETFVRAAVSLAEESCASIPLLLDHAAAIERMEGTGRLSPSLAREFGLVGPAARASGSRYDARSCFRHGLYPERAPAPAHRESGDVLARAQVRGDEIAAALDLLAGLAGLLPDSEIRVPAAGPLPPDRVGVGIVEAWRGELIHWITTGPRGEILRYAIKDPSFNNWTGLAIAVRNNLVADFPLCNKSFNLSYSGNDL